jgi:hypothetical protein
VHSFCQQEKVPCLFPSIPLPPENQGFYPFYFSRGVALEAEVLAKHLRDQGKNAPQRFVQVYRDDEVGRGAAEVFQRSLKDLDIRFETLVLKGGDSSELTRAMSTLTARDGVMLWMNPADIKLLGGIDSKLLPANVYISGFLAEGHYQNMAENLKRLVHVIYPYDLGSKSLANLTKLKAWLKMWKLPLVDDTFQSEVFFNLLLLTDITSQMLDNYYRDYMVERTEDMLSLGANVTTYPNLELAYGQRFASKGAFIAHFGSDGKLVAESEWIVP